MQKYRLVSDGRCGPNSMKSLPVSFESVGLSFQQIGFLDIQQQHDHWWANFRKGAEFK
jgi:hypothetical protein